MPSTSGRSELAIAYRSIEELIPYARNARTHTDAHIAQIAASIREFGWTNPVLVDGDNGIIAGHGRVLAARLLGIHLVPCIELAGLSDAQRRAYILADNKLALNAGWDESLLRLELADLRDMAFDLSLIGFGADEQVGLLTDDDAGSGGSGAGSLSAQFGIPPFTVLNAREGWWQERKRAWLSLGIQSELGRGEGCLNDASPGGAAIPAASLKNGRTVRGDGRGRKANAIPGGGKDAV